MSKIQNNFKIGILTMVILAVTISFIYSAHRSSIAFNTDNIKEVINLSENLAPDYNAEEASNILRKAYSQYDYTVEDNVLIISAKRADNSTVIIHRYSY